MDVSKEANKQRAYTSYDLKQITAKGWNDIEKDRRKVKRVKGYKFRIFICFCSKDLRHSRKSVRYDSFEWES